MAKTYEQPNISTAFVNVASPRVFIAPYGAVPDLTLTSGDIPYVLDIATAVITDGWFDLGTLSGAQMPVTKDFVKYEAGATRTTRKQYEKGRSAQLTFTYHEMMPYVKAFCTGASIYNTKDTGHTETATSGTPTRTTFTVAASANINVGDTLSVIAGGGTAHNTNYKLCVVTAKASNNLDLTVAGLMAAPAAADKVQKIQRTEYKDPIGSIVERTALMFFDYETVSGSTSQYLVWFPKLITNSAYAPDFKDTNDYMTAAVTFEAIATTQTLDDSTSNVVLYRAWDVGQK